MSTFTTIIQLSFGSPTHSTQRRKRNKRNPNCKRKIKLSPFVDDIILCPENPKANARKPFELINEFGEVAGMKLIHRNSLLVYIQTMKDQKDKLRKPFHLPLHQKKKKKKRMYLAVNLLKETKGLCSENSKTLMKTKMTQTDGNI